MSQESDVAAAAAAAAVGEDDELLLSASETQLQPPAYSHDTGAEPVVVEKASGFLPVAEWLACVNEHGDAYFCNVVTGETQWELPPRVDTPAHEAAEDEQQVIAAAADGDAHAQRKSLLLVQQVMDGAMKRVERNVQLQLEEARRRHRELEELRDEQVRLGGEHWVEMFDPTHDRFYYYGAFSGEMRWDRPDSYVLKVESDTVLRLVVQLQCAFRMALARRRVFRAKKARAEQQRRQSVAIAEQKPQREQEEEQAEEESMEIKNEEDQDVDGGEDNEGDDEAGAEEEEEEEGEEEGEEADKVPDGEQFGILQQGSSRWLTSIPEHHQEFHPDQELTDSDDMWVEVYDPLHKLVYYYCAATDETRWDPPSVFITATEDKEMAAAIAIQSLSRSFLARRDVKRRKLDLRKKRQEQAVHEARQLREKHHREFLSKSDDERASICRREMIEEEMAQIRCGDRFWGIDAHDREVRRQQTEERLMAMSEQFWQRVNSTMKMRSELFAQKTKQFERKQHENESLSEADALDAMIREEAQQRRLGDNFWGIQGEEQREERARQDMQDEEFLSRCFGHEAHGRDLRAVWKAEAETNAARSERDKLVFEKRYQKRYMKWFYHACTSVDDLLGYLWPTMQRLEPQTPESTTSTNSGIISLDYRGASNYILDDLVVKQRLENGDLRYGNKSIVTIHHANTAQILGRKGGFSIEKLGETKTVYEAAVLAYKPHRLSPARHEPPGDEMTPEEDEKLHVGTSVHYKRSKTPDPHLPARFNGVPFKPSQISPTRDILCSSHTKLTQLPSLAAKNGASKSPNAKAQPMSPLSRSKTSTASKKSKLVKKNHSNYHSSTHVMRSNNNDSSSNGPRTSQFLQRHKELFQHGNRHNRIELEHEENDDAESRHFENAMRAHNREEESDDRGIGKKEESVQSGRHPHHHHIHRDVLLEQFDLDEHDLLQRVFTMMDYDGSGAVNQKEMTWALQRDEEITQIANQSKLLRVFVKHPAQLDELFLRLGSPSHVSRANGGEDSADSKNRRQQCEQELSWDVFLEFCRQKFMDLKISGVLEPSQEQDPQLHGAGARHDDEKSSSPRDDASLYREEEEEEKIRDLFAILDCDENGVLEIEELRNALSDAANDREIGQLVSSCKALQPLLHQAMFMDAFSKFEPEDPRGISEEEFVAFCLEIAAIAQFNGLM